MLNKIKKILILAPHTDDGELGAGGSISKFIENGAEVFYAAFSTAEQSVPEGLPKDILKTEVRNATAKIGVKEKNLIIYNYEVRRLNYKRQEILENLVNLKSQIEPELIFMPCLNDVHQDHSTIAMEGLRAFKNITILGYELIWNNITFNNRVFIKLEERHVNAKIESLREYKSQGFRDYMSEDFIISLARTRGVQVATNYAESFEVLRWIIE
jgi:LmbE family N-acetylglucosaminyl deacetylase